MPMEHKAIAQAHKVAVHTGTSEIAKELMELLTGQLTALIANVDSERTIKRWASREVMRIPPDKEERLRIAYTIVQLLTQYDAPKIVRSWFIGMNPILDDSPARAIRDGRFQ